MSISIKNPIQVQDQFRPTGSKMKLDEFFNPLSESLQRIGEIREERRGENLSMPDEQYKRIDIKV